ncbi:hypothetical protein [Chromatium okenii]|jgi:hypothetical protein|uniref:hypothetical protein n=1 Tax=Chromatium okenii TaxID=61644 RepID=UPI0026EE7C74|nr:hypothetical protein [Chromatium okenii]MBV5311506.1 hypothetical protein [Chromatium okenii]
MRKTALLNASFIFSLMTNGCVNQPERIDYRRVTRAVAPIEYAQIQCNNIPITERHTCLTAVIEHYEDVHQRQSISSTPMNKPFVLVFDDGTEYRGRYLSNAFAAYFKVDHNKKQCIGQYNAFAGDNSSIFRIQCNNGITGHADIILDYSGKNGIGEFQMSNNKRGRIVFGEAAVIPLDKLLLTR